jgi:hypothetical protein
VFFGLSIKVVPKLAFDLPKKYKLPHTFLKRKFGEEKWIYAFMRINPELSVRQPEATTLARAKGTNMSQYFQLSVYHDVHFICAPPL